MPIHIHLMFELFWLHLWVIQCTSQFYACWSCSSGCPHGPQAVIIQLYCMSMLESGWRRRRKTTWSAALGSDLTSFSSNSTVFQLTLERPERDCVKENLRLLILMIKWNLWWLLYPTYSIHVSTSGWVSAIRRGHFHHPVVTQEWQEGSWCICQKASPRPLTTPD